MTVDDLHRTRGYHWGAVYLRDADQDDFDEASIAGPGPLWPAPRWLTIGVANSRAGEADVALTLVVRDEPAGASGYAAAIDLPTGVLCLGDAYLEDEVRLTPGRWRVQVDLDDPREATSVRIVLSPLGADCAP